MVVYRGGFEIQLQFTICKALTLCFEYRAQGLVGSRRIGSNRTKTDSLTEMSISGHPAKGQKHRCAIIQDVTNAR